MIAEIELAEAAVIEPPGSTASVVHPLSPSYLIAKIRERMDEEIDGVYFSVTEALSALNAEQSALHQEIMLLDKSAFLGSVLITQVPGQEEYDLPGNLAQVKRLEWESNTSEIAIGGFRDPRFLASLRNGKLALWPIPSSSETLRLWYYQNPVDMHYGQATAGSATQILFDSAPTAGAVFSADDYYNGAWIWTSGGTGSGQIVQITDYTGATRIALGAFSTAPSSTTTYEILSQLESRETECLILGAMRRLMQKDGEAQTWALNFGADYQKQHNLLQSFRSKRQVATPIRTRIVC